MLNSLLEIGCEEIPARFVPGFLDDLKKHAAEKLLRERLSFSRIETLGTYRRLTLYIENLAPRQADLAEEQKGPPAEIAFDSSGKPTAAALGFAKTQKVEVGRLIVKPVNGRNYVFAQVVKKGRPTAKVLAALFPEIISAIYLPLAMRWGNLDVKFIRPIHWIAALCGSKTVKFEFAGIRAGGVTNGHRFRKSKIENRKLKIGLEIYKKQMLKLGVVVDQEERKELIKKQVTLAAAKAGGQALIADDLLSEVTFLVENPIAYAGKFKPEFLSIPQVVLITSMKKNQKYFPVVDKAGRLLPKFIVVTDACRNRKVVEGNQKVLSARLADAKFFFEEDRKEPLKLRIPDLDRVAYFEKLGNLGQKSARLAKLAEWLGQRLRLTEEEVRTAKRIAELCKTDLTTKMVYEFPELQGEMGREYALLSGEDPRVALGILEHYLPRFAEDRLPQTLPGKIVALADRLDLLVGCFSLGSIPTGSVDPYGLRRAVVGMIRIISENKLDLLLDETFAAGLKLYEPIVQAKIDPDKLRRQLLEFIAGRLKPLLQEQGIRYDVIDAVLTDYNDILDVAMKAKALNGLVAEAWFVGVVKSADRLFRITKEVKEHDVRAADFVDPQERALYELYLKTNWEVGEAIKKESWLAAIQSLAKLTGPIEQFFDKVLVMHEDERIRRNRLAVIKSLEILYTSVADFKKIVV